MPRNGRIFGHLPMEISIITKYLLDRGAHINAKLSETHYRRSPLVQGGLEIPCTLIIRMPGTVKSSELIKKCLEVFEARYEELQEVVVLGTSNTNINLNNQPNQTAGCSNSSSNSSNNNSKKSKKSVAHGRDLKRTQSELKRHTGFVCKNSSQKRRGTK